MGMRITLGTIEGIIGEGKVSHLGRATFRRKDSFSKVLVVSLPNERRNVEMPEEAPFYNPLDGTNDKHIQREASINFISFVESFLRREGLYLAEVSYKPYRLHFDLPFSERLEGELYQNGK
ncbi:hypothetical protein HYW74_03430 [Candidatus Pacearchaeota archaeon]|nr:hypothetical protein [Candidatus Pacearchaeota archaeon]